jgi:MFS family permease
MSSSDETQPLLQTSSLNDEDKTTLNQALPENWSHTYRWLIVCLLALQAFTVTFTCISLVPVASRITKSLNPGGDNKSSSVLLVTIWELGEAAGPLFIAPLSEIYGRMPTFHATNILFILSIALSAVCQSVDVLVLSRFLTGVAVATNVLNPAVIGDILPPESRGSAMSAVTLAPLIGGAIGPAIAGAIAESLGWRQIIWMALALAVTSEMAFVLFFRETYSVVILRRSAANLGVDTAEDNAVKRAAQAESSIWVSIVRPMSVLYSSFVLQMMSVYGGLSFTFYYVVSTTLPDILEEVYHFTPSMIGTSFLCFSKSTLPTFAVCRADLSLAAGACLSLVITNVYLDRIYRRLQKPGANAAEPRLPLMILGAILLPFSIALYGWTANQKWPAAVMLSSTALMGFICILSMITLMSYIVDAFGVYSASAITSALVTRCLMGTFLPLITPVLAEKVGWGRGFTILAGGCAILAPVPLVVFLYGGKLRQRSKYTKDA